MGQSLTSIYIHTVFRTKFNNPFIDLNIEKELHSYICGILNNKDCQVVRINSMPDHIHILFRMSKNHPIAHVMQIIKQDSSKWMKKKGYSDFKWQIGYGAFSVSPYNLNIVSNYIANQKEHHKKKSLLEEVEKLMDKNGVSEYSREYFWK